MSDFVAAVSMINIDILYEGLLRMPALGEEERAESCEILLGGGAAASVVALSRLGVDARLGTFLSDDMMSNFAKAQLDENKVSYSNLSHGDKNPIAITSIASFPNDRSFLSFFPHKSKIQCSDDELYSLYSGSKVCVGIEGHSEVFKKLRKEGSIVVFDIGWSNDLLIDNMKETLSVVDYFMPNEKEALKMTGTQTPEDALDVISGYVSNAIVKLGNRGCITKINNQTVRFPALDAFKPVDTTGAGDAFMAGLMYGFYKGWNFDKSIKMGNIIGGYSTTKYGCLKAIMRLEDAMKYMEQ